MEYAFGAFCHALTQRTLCHFALTNVIIYPRLTPEKLFGTMCSTFVGIHQYSNLWHPDAPGFQRFPLYVHSIAKNLSKPKLDFSSKYLQNVLLKLESTRAGTCMLNWKLEKYGTGAKELLFTERNKTQTAGPLLRLCLGVLWWLYHLKRVMVHNC